MVSFCSIGRDGAMGSSDLTRAGACALFPWPRRRHAKAFPAEDRDQRDKIARALFFAIPLFVFVPFEHEASRG